MEQQRDYTGLSDVKKEYSFNIYQRIFNFILNLLVCTVGCFMIVRLTVSRGKSFDYQMIEIMIQPGYSIIISIQCFLIDMKIQPVIEKFYFMALSFGRGLVYLFLCGNWSVVLSRGDSEFWVKVLNPARIAAQSIAVQFFLLGCWEYRRDKQRDSPVYNVEDEQDEIVGMKPIQFESD